MGNPLINKTEHWMEAAGLAGEVEALQKRVVTAGEFIENMGQLPAEETCQHLATIDFFQPVTVVRLPNSVFIKYEEQLDGFWFTDTGYSKEAIKLGGRLRRRKLFSPQGVVPALKVTPLEIEDTYALNELFLTVSPITKAKMGSPERGAGTRYLIFNQTCLREI